MSCFQSMTSIVAVANSIVNRHSEQRFVSLLQTQCMETIGKRLERILDGCGKSRRQVALSIEMSPSHLSELINNKKDINKLSIATFMTLCAEVSTTPEYLFYGQGEEMDKAQTGKEAQLLMLFRTVPDDKKDMLLDILKAAGHSGNDAAA